MTENPTQILFVCIENACRSQVAEAITNTKYPGHLEALSAGSKPAAAINPKTRQWLHNNGLDPDRYSPKSVHSLPEKVFDYLISMGCGDQCPSVQARQKLEWNIPDPKNMNDQEFRSIVEQIQTKIEQLCTKMQET